MKRSEINKALKDMHDLIKKFHVSLPPFCDDTRRVENKRERIR